MFNIMQQAQNAIEAYNAVFEIHSANIANMNVTGYKRLDASFQSILDSLLRPGTPASAFSNLGGTNPVQEGQGVALAGTFIDFSQGSATTTNNNTDLYIQGQGLFIVSNDGGSTYQYTRAGQFYKSNGSLVTDKGMQVYGLDNSGVVVPITGLTGALTDYSWDEGTGELQLNGVATGYRIAMTYFDNPNGLLQTSGTTFKESLASGSPATPITVGGSAGSIKKATLEQSNVFYLGESLDSLDIQRAMNANLTTIKSASDMISEFINKLG